ncbi:MAG TPA: Hpt domain-containing protein [Thermodesulfobacteriota bacterium]|nr:Hpt domain-containing protein [Thermodesulfobacteriota bacterium]
MNVKELSESLGLEEDEFLDLVDLFVETSASNLTDLAKALETGNAEEVVKASHSLKGAAGNLGFQEIYERAKLIETNACQGILEGSKEAVTSIREKLRLIEEDVKKIRS